MNHAFKSIWNEKTKTFVAVAEKTASKGKAASSGASLTTGLRKALGNIILTAGLSSIAVAVQAATGVGDGVAIGQSTHTCQDSAQAGHNQAIAIGCSSEASAAGSQFFNRENPDNPTTPPTGRAFYATAIGTGAKADLGGVAIGHDASNNNGFGIAIGANATSENVASIALGPTALATGNTALALGRQSAATADFAQALGNVSSATGKGSLAVGHSATASGNRSIAIGSADIDNAGNTGDQQGTVYQTQEQTLSTGKDSIAFGAAAKATADHTLAIGAHSHAEGVEALALGAHSKADKARSIAVGVGAQANFIDSVALGSNSEVLHNNSVAVGTKSKTNAYNQQAFLVGGVATGAVAVGSVGDERRLQNVAAGALDTDGVNVSQLKQHKTITDKTGGDVANHLGGGSTFNSETGEITNPTYNIGGEDYSNVDSALKASKTEVEEGTNIKVSEDKGDDGQTIYTVSTDTEVEFNKVTVGDVVIDHTANTIVGLSNVGIGNAAPADFATVGRAATEEQLNLSAGSTSTILGGDVTNNNGELTGPFVVNQNDYTTVADAIEGEAAKSKTSVTQGDNIVVTKTQNTDGSDNYEVATSDEVEFNKVTVGDVVIDHTANTIVGLSNVGIGNAAPADFATVGRAATEEQLNLSAGSTSTILGGDVTNNNGELTGPFVVNQNDYTTVAEAIEGEAAKSKTSVSEGDNIVVTKTQNADGSDNYEVATSDEVKFNKVTVGDVVIDNGDITSNNLIVTGKTSLGDHFTVTNEGNVTYTGEIEDNHHIVNKEYVDGKSAELTNLGLSFSGNDGILIEKKLGEKLGIVGGLTDDTKTSSSKNIRTVEKDGNLEIQLAEELEVTSVTAGETVLNNSGLQVGNNVFITNNGLTFNNSSVAVTATGINAGGHKITNVAAGTDLTDAVNVSQLKDVTQDVADLGDRAVKYDGNTGDPKDTITLEGDKGTTITNLADGDIKSGSKDAVNGGQIHDMGDSIAAGMGGGSEFKDGKLITDLNVAGKNYDNVNDALGGVHSDLSTKIDNVDAAANAGWNVTDAKGNRSNIGPDGQVTFAGDKNISVAQTGSDNDGKVEITLNKDLNVNSITAIDVNATNVNTGSININNGGPVINSEGINMNDKRITNVAAGIDGTDAVNVNQLQTVHNDLRNEIGGVRRDLHKVDRKLRAGVAAAMATAGLPQAYLPGKSMVGMAGGTWNGESGIALGVSKITDNGKWIFKVSGNASTRGDYGGTVGAGYQW